MLLQVMKPCVRPPHIEEAEATYAIDPQWGIHLVKIESRRPLQPKLQALSQGRRADHGLRCAKVPVQCLLKIVEHDAIRNRSRFEVQRTGSECFHHVITGSTEANEANVFRVHQSFRYQLVRSGLVGRDRARAFAGSPRPGAARGNVSWCSPALCFATIHHRPKRLDDRGRAFRGHIIEVC